MTLSHGRETIPTEIEFGSFVGITDIAVTYDVERETYSDEAGMQVSYDVTLLHFDLCNDVVWDRAQLVRATSESYVAGVEQCARETIEDGSFLRWLRNN
jgi:hypothetical protein